jgi:hypothetical protein
VDRTSRLLSQASRFESARHCLGLRGGGLFGIGSTGNSNLQQPSTTTSGGGSNPSQSADVVAAEAALDDVSIVYHCVCCLIDLL